MWNDKQTIYVRYSSKMSINQGRNFLQLTSSCLWNVYGANVCDFVLRHDGICVKKACNQLNTTFGNNYFKATRQYGFCERCAAANIFRAARIYILTFLQKHLSKYSAVLLAYERLSKHVREAKMGSLCVYICMYVL